MRISTKTRYGLRAMSLLAKEYPRLISTKEISKKEKIPFDYLEKILIDLEKANLVSTKRGIKGGYFLSLPPQKIKLLRIFQTLERNLTLLPCQLKKKSRSPSQKKKCPIRKVWQGIQAALENNLEATTLDTLAK